MDMIEKIKMRSLESLDTRISVHKFVNDFLKGYDKQPYCSFHAHNVNAFKIWVYWGQGYINMPPIVKACINQLYRTHDKHDIIFLTDDNVHNYIELPDYIYTKLRNNKIHFSDVLRIALLVEYGGAWVDATCYCTGSIAPILAEIQKTGFFAFTISPPSELIMNNWFMASRPNEIIPTLLRDALYCYWMKNEEAMHYFIFHFIFEALYNLDEEFRKSWDNRFVMDSFIAEKIQSRIYDEFDSAEWEAILSKSFIYKLSYKYSNALERPGSFLSHITDSLSDPNMIMKKELYTKKNAIKIFFPFNGSYYEKCSYSFNLYDETEYTDLRIPIPEATTGKLCVSFCKSQLFIEIKSISIMLCVEPNQDVAIDHLTGTTIKEYNAKNEFAGITLGNDFVRIPGKDSLMLITNGTESKLYLNFEFTNDLYKTGDLHNEYILCFAIKLDSL